jgi:hypothetical protein
LARPAFRTETSTNSAAIFATVLIVLNVGGPVVE